MLVFHGMFLYLARMGLVTQHLSVIRREALLMVTVLLALGFVVSL